MRGLEPPPDFSDTDLNRARLPIPPHPRAAGQAKISHRAEAGPIDREPGTWRIGRRLPGRSRERSAPGGRPSAFASLGAERSRAAIVQGTRTPPSHGGNRGSNPRSGMNRTSAEPRSSPIRPIGPRAHLSWICVLGRASGALRAPSLPTRHQAGRSERAQAGGDCRGERGVREQSPRPAAHVEEPGSHRCC